MRKISYTLLVENLVFGDQSSFTALNFAHAVIEEGHKLSKVFFYRRGVTHANSFVFSEHDELDLVKEWQRLALTHDVRLETCLTASLRLGILSIDGASARKERGSNLARGFEPSSLMSLSESLLTEKRVIQF